ncbi:MAG TPA: MarR family transcriptional regulator [Gammaproteobacteria bacterium]|nr:MarR family transcriptional regulator [Gammaproteobacteria bacterium]
MGENDEREIADVLAISAIKLLRLLRASDQFPKLTATEASALGVLVHGGPMSIGSLAQLEQVRAPSMTRTISNLESRKLAERVRDPADARRSIVRITKRGKTLFEEGHERKLAPLRNWLKALDEDDLGKLVMALPVIEAMGKLAENPGQTTV